MRVVEIQVFKFEELSDAAKKKALDDYRAGDEYLGGVFVEEQWSEVLDFMGWVNVRIHWTGFGNQGDGACFTGIFTRKHVQFDKFREVLDQLSIEEAGPHKALLQEGLKILKRTDEDFSCNVTHRGPYSHENSVYFDTTSTDATGDLWAVFEAYFKKVMSEIYSDLQEDYEHSISDEVVTENIIANDWEFTRDGKVWTGERPEMVKIDHIDGKSSYIQL